MTPQKRRGPSPTKRFGQWRRDPDGSSSPFRRVQGWQRPPLPQAPLPDAAKPRDPATVAAIRAAAAAAVLSVVAAAPRRRRRREELPRIPAPEHSDLDWLQAYRWFESEPRPHVPSRGAGPADCGAAVAAAVAVVATSVVELSGDTSSSLLRLPSSTPSRFRSLDGAADDTHAGDMRAVEAEAAGAPPETPPVPCASAAEQAADGAAEAVSTLRCRLNGGLRLGCVALQHRSEAKKRERGWFVAGRGADAVEVAAADELRSKSQRAAAAALDICSAVLSDGGELLQRARVMETGGAVAESAAQLLEEAADLQHCLQQRFLKQLHSGVPDKDSACPLPSQISRSRPEDGAPAPELLWSVDGLMPGEKAGCSLPCAAGSYVVGVRVGSALTSAPAHAVISVTLAPVAAQDAGRGITAARRRRVAPGSGWRCEGELPCAAWLRVAVSSNVLLDRLPVTVAVTAVPASPSDLSGRPVPQHSTEGASLGELRRIAAKQTGLRSAGFRHPLTDFLESLDTHATAGVPRHSGCVSSLLELRRVHKEVVGDPPAAPSAQPDRKLAAFLGTLPAQCPAAVLAPLSAPAALSPTTPAARQRSVVQCARSGRQDRPRMHRRATLGDCL
eukprot:TRINITY_DN7147_c0_g1_i7.p1 TRINITY_DN7147_c0_g1~~TRINITY_DN7147_c0_g1_i7.p1  ORF type:complete len:617 (+),score=136.22 TRINITY_DN7147_c0_g1_i7:1008-2858(+)